MQKKQSAGIDTRARLTVYACIFSVICEWAFPWISGIGKLKKLPLTMAEADLISGIFKGRQTAAVILTILMAACIFAVFKKKQDSKRFVKICFFVNAVYKLAELFLVFAGNILVNDKMEIKNTFLTLSIDSYIQASSWVYAELILSLVIFFTAGSLLDITGGYKPQKYIERAEKKDRGIGKRTMFSIILLLTAIPFVIFFGIFFLNDRSNVFIGVCIICLAMLPFAMIFEERRPQAREILLIAVMTAVAVVGRMAFFMVPQFKPVTAVVIISGIGLGAEAGFLTGAVAGFVSNFFFGQGPWTPWQMFAFGIIGFLAGLIFNRKGGKADRGRRWEKAHKFWICVYGGAAAFVIYGFIMDIASVVNFVNGLTGEIFLSGIVTGIPFNLVHAGSTVIFLFFLERPMEKKIERIKKKYGIMEA